MQTSRFNYRYRGQRSSYTLVALGKSLPADIATLNTEVNGFESSQTSIGTDITSVVDINLSKIVHMLVQLNYALANAG